MDILSISSSVVTLTTALIACIGGLYKLVVLIQKKQTEALSMVSEGERLARELLSHATGSTLFSRTVGKA